MASYSGIYLGYEGTTAQCNLKQRPRETVYDTDSGLMRYMTSNSGIVYFNLYDPSIMTSGYLSKWGGTTLRNSIISDSGLYANIHGNLKLTADACPVNVDAFLVHSGGFIQYRTAAEVLSDIGAIGAFGSGTLNYLPLWTSSGTLTDSLIYQDADTVFIGTQLINVSGSLEIGIEDSDLTVKPGLILARSNTGSPGVGQGISINFYNESYGEPNMMLGGRIYSSNIGGDDKNDLVLESYYNYGSNLQSKMIISDASYFTGSPFTFKGNLLTSGTAYFRVLRNADDSYNWMEMQCLGLAHGMTGLASTTAFFGIDTADTTKGGAVVYGLTAQDDRVPLNLNAIRGTTVGGGGESQCIALKGSRKNGTASTSIADTSRILTIDNWTASKVTVYGNGDTKIAGNISLGTAAAAATNYSLNFSGQLNNSNITWMQAANKFRIADSVEIRPSSASSVGLSISGYTSQTAHLQTWVNSSGVAQAYVQANGRIYTSNGIRSDAILGGGSLMLWPEEGLVVDADLSSNLASYDYTGGTYDALMTDPSGVFNSGYLGKWVIIRTGEYQGAMAEITDVVDSGNAILHTMGWDFDISNFGYYIIEHPQVVIGDGYHMEFMLSNSGHFDLHSIDWKGNNYTNNLFEVELEAGKNLLHGGFFETEANGYGNITSIYSEYISGPLGSGLIGNGIVSRIVTTNATGDSTTEVSAYLARIANGSSITTTAYKVLPGFSNALEVQGAQALDPDFGYNITDATGNVYDRVTGTPTSGTAFLEASPDDITLFNAVNDYILIGGSGTFEIIEVDLTVNGSKSIIPSFQYSTGDGTWNTLSVLSDGTNGFQQPGQISFNAPVDWAAGETAEVASDIASGYYVRISRTYAPTIGIKPVESHFKIYESRATGMLIRGDGSIQPVELTDAGAVNNSIYYSTTQNALVYKDSGGSVNTLY